jgi:hypothetical protein
VLEFQVDSFIFSDLNMQLNFAGSVLDELFEITITTCHKINEDQSCRIGYYFHPRPKEQAEGEPKKQTQEIRLVVRKGIKLDF